MISNPAGDDLTVEDPGWLRTVLLSGLVVVAIVGLLSWFTISAAHINDRYMIDQSPGTMIALAWNANNGLLYPPLYDGEFFGGTRYMPLYILVHAGVAQVTGEYLISGKIVAYTGATALLLTMIHILRRHRCDITMSLALIAGFVMSMPGFHIAYSIRSDGIALLWSLVALILIHNSPTARTAAIAGVFCALGILSKMSAVWAPIAIVIWLGYMSPKRCLIFGVATSVATILPLFILDLITDGRLRENLFSTSVSGIANLSAIVMWSPGRIVEFMTVYAPMCFVLVPISVLSLFVAVKRREFSVFHVAFLCQIPLLLVLFSDVGVGENHLADLFALTIILTGEFWARELAIQRSWSTAMSLVAAAVIWVSAISFGQFVARDFLDAGVALIQRKSIDRYTSNPLKDVIASDEKLLLEDPYLAVMINQRPIVIDSFFIRRLDDAHTEWIDELIGRIENRDFDKIVLTQEPDPDSWWYDRLFFGSRVTRAIQSNYGLVDELDGYHVLVPEGDELER